MVDNVIMILNKTTFPKMRSIKMSKFHSSHCLAIKMHAQRSGQKFVFILTPSSGLYLWNKMKIWG